LPSIVNAPRIAVAALLLWSLTSCQPLPHPLAANAPPPDAPIMALKDGAGIAVAPVDGLPAPLAGQLAEALAEALRDADVPASTAARNRRSYTLRSAAEEREAPGGRATIVLRWELLEPGGKPAGRDERTVETDLPSWRAGSAPALEALAKSAAPSIAFLLQEEGAGAADGGQRLVVPLIAGAPGDGSQTLANAMRNALRRASFDVAERPDPGAGKQMTLVGTVALGPVAAKQQDVTIIWSLRDAGGGQIGEVKQQNRIPAGSLDGAWGDIAYAVASSAAPGITALLDQLKLARTGAPGSEAK
jgi:hypothetical protein